MSAFMVVEVMLKLHGILNSIFRDGPSECHPGYRVYTAHCATTFADRDPTITERAVVITAAETGIADRAAGVVLFPTKGPIPDPSTKTVHPMPKTSIPENKTTTVNPGVV